MYNDEDDDEMQQSCNEGRPLPPPHSPLIHSPLTKFMKQGTATKKSGTIAYQLYERNDLTGKSTKKNPTMGVSVVSSRVVTTKEMADDINHASSVTQSDVAAVLQAVGQRIAEALLDGNRIEIDHVGTFSLTLTCGNKRKEDYITSKDISVSRISFAPCAELWKQMPEPKL